VCILAKEVKKKRREKTKAKGSFFGRKKTKLSSAYSCSQQQVLPNYLPLSKKSQPK
jgi:hypothetical protein